MSDSGDVNIHTIDESRWEEAKRREPYISSLYEKQCANVLTREDVKVAASNLGLSIAQVYNLLKQYKINPVTSALVRKKRGWKKGSRRLSTEQEEQINIAIEQEYKKAEKVSGKAVHDCVMKQCKKLDLPVPCAKTVLHRIQSLPPQTIIPIKKGHKKARDKLKPVVGRMETTKPMEVIQIDHTLVDIIIVDDVYREPLCRPWLTLAIDVHTRMVAGYYLSLERPSTISVATVISHAVLPKDKWLKENDIDIEWPVKGLPSVIHVDNGKEFRSKAFIKGADEYGIIVKWRPVKTPNFGGHIERLIGTVMGSVHMLPGTTFSNVQERGDYDSEGKARLTFEEAERWIALEILGKYHHAEHRGIRVSPMVAWKNSSDPNASHKLQSLDHRKLFLDFLPFCPRTITREGIQFNYIYYWDDVLSTWLGLSREQRKVLVHYNPRNLSEVYIFKDGRFWALPYKDLSRPPITLSELNKANKLLTKIGKESIDESMIFSTIEAQRTLVAEATRKYKAARKAVKMTQQSLESTNDQSRNDSNSQPHKEDKIDFTNLKGFKTIKW